MRGILWLLNKYNYILVFIVLEVLAFVMLSRHNAYQHSVLVNANREVSGAIYKKVEGAREYLYLRKNNESLVHENSMLRNKILSLQSSISDTQIHNTKTGSYFYTPARIVHSTHFKQYNYITIDKGKKQGVNRDMAVIGEQGIVGIVLESSSNFSTIIPVINRDFRLGAKIKKNNYSGILQWEGNSPQYASLNEIPHHAPIAIGDTIVTSGYSAIFPEGIFVGTVVEYAILEGNFYKIKIDLGTEFQSLFYVNVIKNFHREEQLELESNLKQ